MESFAITDKGMVRETNQDYVYCSDESIGILPNLYAVADGMGGYSGGDFASKYCIETVVNELKNNVGRTIVGAISNALSVANAGVIAEAAKDPKLSGMGTTFVSVCICGKTAYAANVGDSRLYRYRNDLGLVQVTVDHSLVEEMIRDNKIERKDAKHHPKKNLITKAVGAMESIDPDFYEIDVEPGELLMLCSDGLSNMLEEETIRSILSNDDLNLEEKSDLLVKTANEHGGKDNISVVLVRI